MSSKREMACVVTTNGRRFRLGRRVWVLTSGQRAYGEIASLPEPFLGSKAFVVLLDGKSAAITCIADRQGTQWDFADFGES